jgi:succinoglycan biosynthesis protein ExoA
MIDGSPEGIPARPGMKVVLLAPANVVHTQRWVEGLLARGLKVVLATQHDESDWRPPAAVRVVRLRHSGRVGYFLNIAGLRRLLRDERPDLLNAHYASGYGTTAALSGFSPVLLSVWGSDVYDFPYQGRLQSWLLRHNLRRADALASTSEAMAEQVRRLLPTVGAIAITPFGVDVERFAPAPRVHAGIVIGTVKTLAPKYGIDVLVRAFAELVAGLNEPKRGAISLVVVGGGEQRSALEALVVSLGIASQVRFVGSVPHAEVPRWLNGFDVYVAASRLDSESFGVAVLEASACGLPVVVSDAGGLPEVVVDGETGLVVPRDDAPALARALRRLVESPSLRARLGHAGRQRVVEHYEWRRCVETMVNCYSSLLAPVGTSSEPRLSFANAPRANVVSVIVPCRNERLHIDAFCTGALRQILPPGWESEVIVADGSSDDGTAELLAELAVGEPGLRVIDNPRRIVSAGLNLALARSSGAVVVRMDVHTEYATDYIARCLEALAASGADNVGGPWHAKAEMGGEPMQRALAAAFQSRWVSGGALSRRLDYDGWTDTVYLGCWPRATFSRVGGFDEDLVRNQDDEHNLRIVRGGGRIWQASAIQSLYRPRTRLAQVFRQYLQYGYWKPFVMKKHAQAAQWRQLVPAAFIAALTISAIAGPWPFVTLVTAYVLAVAAMTVGVARTAALDAAALLRVPAVIATFHTAYGIGSIAGWCDAFVLGKRRERFSRLTR